MINQKKMKVKSIEELRYYVINMVKDANDISLISKAYEAVSGNIVTDRIDLDNCNDDFVCVYEP